MISGASEVQQQRTLLRPYILAILPGFVPSTIIDVVQPLTDLSRAGVLNFRVTLESLFVKRDLDGLDLVVLCRNVEPKGIFEAIRAKGIRYVYDLDDNLFETPLSTALGLYHRSPERILMMERYIQNANLVRVYSEPMFQRCSAMNSAVEKVVAPVNWNLIQAPARQKSGQPVRIVYVTSRVEDDLFKIFMPALDRLISEFPEKVEVYFWGRPPEQYSHRPGFHSIPPVPDYNRFLKLFSSKGFDIGLAPLFNDVFHLSKTNNKYREYGASRVAGVYSDVDVYNQCVEDGKTGLLVPNNPQDWYEALRRLVEDPALRQRIQEGAYQYTYQNYHPEQFNALWLEQIRWVCARTTETRSQLQTLETDNSSSNLSGDYNSQEGRFSSESSIVSDSKETRFSKILKKLKRVRQEDTQGILQFIRWGSFTVWTLIKVNIFKRL